MPKALVGFTGFVGSNLMEQVNFDFLYNSKNIEEAFDKRYDILVYSGIRAEKYLANQNPEQDLSHINEAINHIKRLRTDKLILISTIDVYNKPSGVDESSCINEENLQPYGRHRRILEKWVEQNVHNSIIVRLPALYGKNMKKNFLFDIINLIPTMISKDRFSGLQSVYDFNLKKYYDEQNNGFYKVKELSKKEKKFLKEFFKSCEFNALNFTDERNEYPFFNLKYLWGHIETAIQNKIKLLNITCEPVSAKEIYEYSTGKKFNNIIQNYTPVKYDIRTIHHEVYNGKNGYIFSKKFVLNDIKEFLNRSML